MKRVMQKHPRVFQQGLSLVELMVALVLGLFVVGSLVALYINTKETYLMTENMSRLQENGRIALTMMARDIRWADYRTCVTNDLNPNAVAGTDGNAFVAPQDTITTIFQSNGCGQAPATTTTTYSVGTGASGQPSLFRSINGGNAVEMVEGIQNLQVLYGEDTDRDFVPNYYVNIGNISDASQIVSVRLTLTAQTAELIRAAQNSRITRNFTSTIVLRNRVP